MGTPLVPLPEVERLSASVIRILAGNPGKAPYTANHYTANHSSKHTQFTLQGTNTYLVGRGRQRILIDTGEGKPTWASHLQTILAQENATVHQALLTHWHGDHVHGVPDLLRLCPQAAVFKHDPEDGQTGIEDGQMFGVEGATLRACHTPGHTTDHIMFLFVEEDALFTGDNVLGHGTAVFEDLRDYLSSLHRMQNRVSGRGYPGHGPVIPNATSKITEYIQHRQQREDEILRVLRYGKLDVRDDEPSPDRKKSWTPLELVQVIYKNVPESLHLPASHGVIQVLNKLEEEGKVVHDGESGKWRLSGRPSL